MSWLFVCLAICGGLLSCSPHSSPLTPVLPQTGDGLLSIQTEKTEYSWDEIALGTGSFQATLSNHTDQTFHATLGDALNSASEQAMLFVAEGSDGFLEQRVSASTWKSMQRPILDEGVRSIVIRPHATYAIVGHAVGAKTTGVFRLRIQYSDGAEIQAGHAHQDYSNVFTIQ